MNGDNSELIAYLDERFTKIEKVLVEKADKADVRVLADAVDAYAKKADTFFQEMVMLAHKVDRHEKWLLQIADKLGIRLEY